MAYSARVLLDSIGPAGVRLTTLEVTFPRFVLSEFNTHRVYSRNSASSRAVPTSKLLEKIENDPVLPLEWGRNKAGMSANDVLDPADEERAKSVWLSAREAAVEHARRLMELKVHKQELNRILEPFLWHTVIVTSTEWENFFTLRCAPTAQPEIREAAVRMRAALAASTPRPVAYGGWHLPLVQNDERVLDMEAQKKISAARCARVSLSYPRGHARDRERLGTARPAEGRPALEPVRARGHAGARCGVPRKLPRMDSDAPGDRSVALIASAAQLRRGGGEQRDEPRPHRDLDRQPRAVARTQAFDEGAPFRFARRRSR